MKKRQEMRQALQRMPQSIQHIREAFEVVDKGEYALMFRDWTQPATLVGDRLIEGNKVKRVIAARFDSEAPPELAKLLEHSISWIGHLLITIDGMSKVGSEYD